MSPSPTYVSTRGDSPEIGFADALLSGPAPDGGLYVPKAWPALDPALLRDATRLDYPEVAAAVLASFAGDAISEIELKALAREAYASFDTPKVAPLRELRPNLWLLELFHGPTLAFKDISLQLVGRLLDRELGRRGRRAVILGATSGDTGAAAIAALAGLSSVDVFILHPKGRISEVQRRQMTTVTAENIHNIAVEDTFDAAQSLVKAAFADPAFRASHNLSAVNSINWARVAAQIVYYVTAASALGGTRDRRASFAVPTGNFGDIFAGYCALRMGAPIERLVIATNENDILVRALEDGRYQPEKVVATSSPAMDIQVSSNFERLLFEANGRDGRIVRELMKDLQSTGRFGMSKAALSFIRASFDAERVGEPEVLRMIRDVYDETKVVVDPHTAVGLVAAGRHLRRRSPMVVLATADPAKFPGVVEQATGLRPLLPRRLQPILSAPEHYDVLPADIEAVKAYISDRAKV